jgi:hypothetical protein
MKGNKVFLARDKGDHQNFGIYFGNGVALSLGFGKAHYCGDTTAEVCVIDGKGLPITGKYIDTEDLVCGYVSLGRIIKLMTTLYTEHGELEVVNEG